MPSTVTWQSDDRCVVGGTVFQTLPVDLLEQDRPQVSMEGADFWLFKEEPLIRRYVELVDELAPRNIFELGIFQGGSTAFLAELAEPDVLVTIDERPPRGEVLREYVSKRDLGDVVRIYDDVDQADRGRLAEIVKAEFGDEPLDLVIDDCSHMTDPTRASFNELFPRLRPGGVYVIEDWPWGLGAWNLELWGDEVPLARVIIELVLAVPSVPRLISQITIEESSVELRRGDAEMDPADFDVSEHSTERGRALLAG